VLAGMPFFYVVCLRDGSKQASVSPLTHPCCMPLCPLLSTCPRRYAKFEMSVHDVARARACYERALESMGEDAHTVSVCVRVCCTCAVCVSHRREYPSYPFLVICHALSQQE
jgi:hypothetical protein